MTAPGEADKAPATTTTAAAGPLTAEVAAGNTTAIRRLLDNYSQLGQTEQAEVLRQLAFAAPTSTTALGALLQLIDDHRLARRTIAPILTSDAEIDDAHQDVLVVVARSVGSYRGDAAFTTWLHTISRNMAIDHLRRRRDANSLDQTAEFVDPATGRLSSLIARRADVQAAIDNLPDHYRQAVRLRDIDGHSYQDIAQELGIKVDTVKSRISRGRTLLAAALGHHDPDLEQSP